MAETLLSPGVLARENDQSFITQQPAEVGAAIIGPTALGPVEIPTLVTSFSEYTAIFGTTVQSASVAYSYFTSLTANNYFQSGGTSLLVTRVTPEDFTASTSSFINTVDGSELKTGTGADIATNAAALFAAGVDAGSNFTGSGAVIYTGATFTTNGSGTGATFQLDTAAGAPVAITASTAGTGYNLGDTLTFSTNDNGGSPIVTTSLLGSTGFAASDSYNVATVTSATFSTTSTTATSQAWSLTFAGGAGASNLTAITATSAGEGVKEGDTFTWSAADLNTAIDAAVGGTSTGATDVVLTVTAADLTAGTFTVTLVATNLSDDVTPFELETISEGSVMNTGTTELTNGALVGGTAENVRWSVASVNTGSGTFSLLVRRGNDNANQQVVLEQYSNLSLDPYSPNYISAQIGDISKNLVNEGSDYYIQESGSYANISRYLRVKSVNLKTPNYFDNNGQAKEQFTGSLPAIQSGSFNGADGDNITTSTSGRIANFYSKIGQGAGFDTQGLTGSNYNNAIALLGNIDEYQYNVISAPGLLNATHASQITSLVNNSINRGDNISVVDLVQYGSTVASVSQAASGFDSSYTATYWPWVQVIDPQTGELVYAPASTMIPGVYVFTDASSEPWFAPAGLTRGALGQVVRAERKLTANNRDTLYESNVNPLATFPQSGVVVFGQKTLQKRASALDRVNVRRLLISLKGFISGVADGLVFEQNTIATRNNFLSVVNPYLEGVQQRQGLYAFKVVMDDTNNTPSTIDRNELVGQIYLQPTKTAEFVVLDFNVLPTGATFPA
jgi:phage tail sheath protein FI